MYNYGKLAYLLPLVLGVWLSTTPAFAINESTNTAVAPTKTEGSVGYPSFDLHSNQRVTFGGTSGGGAGIATANAPTLSEGSGTSFSFDLVGNVRFTMGTALAGEDLTATGAFAGGVQVVEFRYLSSGTKTADYQVKATPGFVHNMVCIGTDAAATVGTIKIFDNTAESGTELFSWTTVAVALNTQPITFPLDVVAATGIYLGYTTVADVQCTVSYR